jgi:aspartyl-tRNA(Asn)/glutamyl-tRNA(Gln) amidotransferase subunit C
VPIRLDIVPGECNSCTTMDKSELYLTADLAQIGITEEEADLLAEAVSSMVEYFSRMDSIDVTDLEPTTHALLRRTRTRPDVVETHPETGPDELLENAPELEDRFIVIPNVL